MVDECLGDGPVRVARIDGAIVGWIGGHHVYSRVWELHPLVVARTAQRRVIGRALVAGLERIAAARGAMTLVLVSDDEVGLTSLAGVELYPDPLEHLARLEDRRGHAFTFSSPARLDRHMLIGHFCSVMRVHESRRKPRGRGLRAGVVHVSRAHDAHDLPGA